MLIITHEGIGSALFNAARLILRGCPIQVQLLSASYDCDLDEILNTATRLVNELDQGRGVLILTDLIGATPSNIARHIETKTKISVVSGLNLSMLVRVMNYPTLNLGRLTEKAISGGVDGIELVYKNDQEENNDR